LLDASHGSKAEFVLAAPPPFASSQRDGWSSPMRTIAPNSWTF
jgi:hypothetical protein